LDNRLLRALAGVEAGSAQALPEDAILIARELGPAELLDYGARLKGVALEEGANTAHAAIVARALGIPMVGSLQGLLSRVEGGDRVVLDGERGEARLRPEEAFVHTYKQRINLRSVRAEEFARLKNIPPVTQDGERVTLLLNAGLALDVHHLDEAGAEGIGLFRTEFHFMVSETLPRLESQTMLYRDVLDAAGLRPVTFRTRRACGRLRSAHSISAATRCCLTWRRNVKKIRRWAGGRCGSVSIGRLCFATSYAPSSARRRTGACASCFRSLPP
jgi:phosphotransferase system enzyme I (PtsP)